MHSTVTVYYTPPGEVSEKSILLDTLGGICIINGYNINRIDIHNPNQNNIEIRFDRCNFHPRFYVKNGLSPLIEINYYLCTISDMSSGVSSILEPLAIQLNNLPEGDFVAWKQVKSRNNRYVLCKLLIPEDAIKYSFGPRGKCRASKAKVLGFYTHSGNKSKARRIGAIFNSRFIYEVGKEVIPDSFDPKYVQCSNGIHFFLKKKDAINYR